MARIRSDVFHVSEEEARRTLSSCLRGWLPDQSWSNVRQLVAARRVLIDGNLCVDPNRRMATGQVVKLVDRPEPKAPAESDVRVVFWDADVVVVHKPAGVTSVRHVSERSRTMRRRQFQATLEDFVNSILRKLDPRKRGARVRPVHRLDRDTSGLMVFARTVAAERSLGAQFKAHSTDRRYLAIAEGDVQDGCLRRRLVRDRGDGRRGTTSDEQAGKSAATHVRVKERLGEYALVECRLETGRTHQIRIHLSDRGWPLCGEKVYRQPLHGPPRVDRSGAPRLALHAALLGFEHPRTGERLRFESAPPRDMAGLLRKLRKQAKRNSTE